MELRLVSKAFFPFFCGVYFLLTGNKKASDLKGINAFKIEDGSPSRTIKS